MFAQAGASLLICDRASICQYLLAIATVTRPEIKPAYFESQQLQHRLDCNADNEKRKS